MSRFDELMALRGSGMSAVYSDRDALLYALSIGMGRDPYHPGEMPFVNEFAGQKVVPAFATVLARGLLVAEHVDYAKIVHARQRIDMHALLPAAGEVVWDATVTDIQDKGTGRGAFITIQTELRTAGGQALATLTSTVMARGDGGLGGPERPVAPRPADMPTRMPDWTIAFETRRDQAALYRLNGDRNPLHIDPRRAAELSLPEPILHGLCTYGIACRAVLESACDYDPARIQSFDVRFSAPAYPGETLTTVIWREGGDVVFRCIAMPRNVVVLDHGRCVLAPAA